MDIQTVVILSLGLGCPVLFVLKDWDKIELDGKIKELAMKLTINRRINSLPPTNSEQSQSKEYS
jgi:hypothetical protein